MELIDKSALVAEIKRRKELVSDPILLGNDLMIGERNAYFNLLSFIDTLEVKELDLEKEIQKAFIYHESHGDDFRSDCQIETAFRTGFEDGFKCKGYISKIQVNNLKEEIKRYFNEKPIMTRSKGVDYKLIPSAEEIAKHFFELGLLSTITEEDCKLIWNIGDEIPNMPEEEFFKELLKRYKTQKGEEV